MKASRGDEKAERAKEEDQGVAPIPQEAQEALQSPCKECQLQGLFRGHQTFIQEAEVLLLHLQDHYLLGE